MTITPTKNNEQMTLALGGRLDTTTAPELEKTITSQCDGVTELVIDMANLEYISSAGLRVILGAKKRMDSVKGSLTITNVCDEIMDVFDMTGFSDILNIK